MDLESPLPLAVSLPTFRQPYRAPLDELEGSPRSTSPDETSPGPSPESPPAADRPEPIESKPAPRAAGRTRTSATDPAAAGKALAGLLAIVLTSVGLVLSRSGRSLRQPTERQLRDIAEPIGAIGARHLPIDIGPDAGDVTTAAAALHAYVLGDGAPLITRTAATEVDYPKDDYR